MTEDLIRDAGSRASKESRAIARGLCSLSTSCTGIKPGDARLRVQKIGEVKTYPTKVQSRPHSSECKYHFIRLSHFKTFKASFYLKFYYFQKVMNMQVSLLNVYVSITICIKRKVL